MADTEKVRIKTWNELLKVGKFNGVNIKGDDSQDCDFIEAMRYLCGEIVKKPKDDSVFKIDGWTIEPWMYEVLKDNRLPIIAVDMDGVLVNLLDSMIDYYNIIWNDSITQEDVKGWRVRDYVKGEAFEYTENILKLPNFYLNAEPIEGAIDGIRALQDKYEIVILTDPYVEESISQKIQWIKKHIPWLTLSDIIFTNQKSLIKADYIIDDNIDNIKGFLKSNNLDESKGLLFSHPFNDSVEYGNKVKSWSDIIKQLVEGN